MCNDSILFFQVERIVVFLDVELADGAQPGVLQPPVDALLVEVMQARHCPYVLPLLVVAQAHHAHLHLLLLLINLLQLLLRYRSLRQSTLVNSNPYDCTMEDGVCLECLLWWVWCIISLMMFMYSWLPS